MGNTPVFGGQPITFFVATNGNNAWSGKLPAPNSQGSDGPFASIEQARDAIRQAKAGLGTTASIVVGPGDHYLGQGIVFESQDSRASNAPLTIKASKPGSVRLIGGRKVTQFSPVQDPTILQRLPESSRDKVVCVDLKALGINSIGTFKSRGFGRGTSPATLELFFNHSPMPLAHWPNSGYATIAGIPEGFGGNDGHGGTIGKLEEGYLYSGDRPSSWQNLHDIIVHGYWAWDWANSYEQIAAIDPAKRLIKLASPYGHYGYRKGQRVQYFNILEELDEPGEWYLDSSTLRLYFLPPAPLSSAEVLVSTLEQPIIGLRNASFIRVEGFTLECARGHGIQIRNGNSNLVSDCVLRNLGNYAVSVSGGLGNGVSGCEITQTGDGGIEFSGGDRKTIAPCGHFAEHNHIHHVARWSKCYVPAIQMSGVGIRASHNLIHDHPHCGILFSGNEHVIEYNEIHRTCLETGDVGAIYTGRNYTYRGNVIRYNYIHDTGGLGLGSMGAYMDDCVSGTLIQGNAFYKVQRAAFLGGGRDHKVINNLFVDCNPAVALDGRGLDKSPVWHDMVMKFMKHGVEEMNYLQPPYSVKYPEIMTVEKYYEKDDGVPPENNEIIRNASFGGKWKEINWHAREDKQIVRDNVVETDLNLVEILPGRIRVKDDAKLKAIGFEPIPFDEIGPRKSP